VEVSRISYLFGACSYDPGASLLGVLLQIQDDVEGLTPEDHPARYAAEHWTTHAQFGDVSSRLHKGMEYLFDANKPHFNVWLTLCDIDPDPDDDDATFSFSHYHTAKNRPRLPYITQHSVDSTIS